MTRLLGVDGCPKGWVGILEDAGQLSIVGDASLGALLDKTKASVTVVDMPIGLSDTQPARPADLAARAALPGKASSVFNTPIRAAIFAQDQTEAQAISRAVTGQGIPPVTWAIVPKIREVDLALADRPGQVILEGHPEVSFAVANGGVPVRHRKISAAGMLARLALLRNEGIDVSCLEPAGLPSLASMDDLLDAAIMLWTARRASQGIALHFPEDTICDAHGRPMQITA